jgi:predicted DCC family thiol-disulfide oxidoreductase YuxK
MSMIAKSRAKTPVTVWIDGSCSVCRRSEQWCSARDPHHRIEFLDLHEAHDVDLPESRKDMMTSVHLVRRDGSVAAGFEAWRAILLELDGWRWLARLAGLPLVRQAGRVVYSLVARWRHGLGS